MWLLDYSLVKMRRYERKKEVAAVLAQGNGHGVVNGRSSAYVMVRHDLTALCKQYRRSIDAKRPRNIRSLVGRIAVPENMCLAEMALWWISDCGIRGLAGD